MTRTNEGSKHGAMVMILLLFWGCDANTVRPPKQAVPVESATIDPFANSVDPVVQAEKGPEAIVAGIEDKRANDNPANVAAVAPTECQPVESSEVVHYAEMRGRIETHTGKRLTIEPLVVTSATLPVPGCMANMFIEMKNDAGQLDWRHFAEVRVASRLHFGMPMEVELVEPIHERQWVQATSETLAKGSRVRIQWVW